MAEHFLKLSDGDRRDALRVASNACGRPTHLLEKDVWVVWALETVFATSFGPHLVFKGGTSLSKAYQAIHRFSEDVDLTYDIRAIAPDLVSDNAEALPPNRSQEKKWSKEIRSRLNTWIATDALPAIERALTSDSLTAHARAEDDKIIIDYEPLTSGTGYVRPAVLLEFGARATGEPWETRPVACDAATHLPQLEFPHATPQVMKAERTFWEKATAIHVFCLQGRFRGAERFARHWYDITRLDELGYAAQAFADADIATPLPVIRPYSFRKRPLMGNSSIIWQRSLEDCALRQKEKQDDFSRKTIAEWWMMDYFWTKPNHSRRCWRIAKGSN